jgi:hypothetical protein
VSFPTAGKQTTVPAGSAKIAVTKKVSDAQTFLSSQQLFSYSKKMPFM